MVFSSSQNSSSVVLVLGCFVLTGGELVTGCHSGASRCLRIESLRESFRPGAVLLTNFRSPQAASTTDFARNNAMTPLLRKATRTWAQSLSKPLPCLLFRHSEHLYKHPKIAHPVLNCPAQTWGLYRRKQNELQVHLAEFEENFIEERLSAAMQTENPNPHRLAQLVESIKMTQVNPTELIGTRSEIAFFM